MLRVLCLVVAFGWASHALSTKSQRGLSLFNLVRFDNDMCTGDKRNGTCFTKEECEARDGKESGTCAEGFGVCCIIELKCGKASSDNNTYLVEESPEAGEGCTYEICPSASSICRIRYDFTEHTIADPVIISSKWGADNTEDYFQGASGYCTSDTFTIINSGATSSPVICGNNKGQHMILDSNGSGCQKAVFAISSETKTRKWEIHVTQYSCNDVENTLGGPKGCLQYFTGATGWVRSFNFPDDTSGNLDQSTSTHLQNQDYKICIKKAADKTRACFTPIGSYKTAAMAAKQTYGISGDNAGDEAKIFGVTDSACTTDYLAIPGGAGLVADATAAGNYAAPAKEDVFKICGRNIASIGNDQSAADSLTFCTLKSPFVINVFFDDGEVVTGTAGKADMLTKIPQEHIGSGTIGFGLVYAQT